MIPSTEGTFATIVAGVVSANVFELLDGNGAVVASFSTTPNPSLVFNHQDAGLFSTLAWTVGGGGDENVTLYGPEGPFTAGRSTIALRRRAVSTTAVLSTGNAAAMMTLTESATGGRAQIELAGSVRVFDTDPEIAYTPALTSTGTFPTIGGVGAVASGVYERIARRIFGNSNIECGTTATPGTGSYILSLPVAPLATPANIICGTGFVYDSSANRMWFALVNSAGSIWVADSSAGNYQMTNAIPFALGPSDQIKIAWNYPMA